MNFFVFDAQARRILVSDDFWKFVVTWIPLTLLTFLGYGLMMLKKQKKKKVTGKGMEGIKNEIWRGLSPGLGLKAHGSV